jgi:hypothetical protein
MPDTGHRLTLRSRDQRPTFKHASSNPPLPTVLGDLQHGLQIMRLDSIPEPTQLGILLPSLLLPPEPFFHASDPLRVDLVEEPIVAPDDAFVSSRMLPHVPEAGEVLSLGHGGWIVCVGVVSGCILASVPTRRPVRVQVDVDVARRVACDALEGLRQFSVVDMLDGHFEIHAVRSLWVIEDPAHVVLAIFQGNVRDGTVAQRQLPSHHSVFNDRSHWGPRGDTHFDVWAGGEHTGAHPVLVPLILPKNPFTYPSLAVVVTTSELGIVSALLVDIVEVAIYEKFDPFLDGELVRTHRPEDLRFLAAVEAVDVDVGSVAAPEPVAQVFCACKRPFHELDVAQGQQLLCTRRVRVPGQDSALVFLVVHQTRNDWYALGAGSAHNEDLRYLIGRRHVDDVMIYV